MAVKILLLLVFFAIMIAVGIYSRKKATNVNDFVLGGRSVGPWMTAFAFGTSYFSSVVFVGYAGQFGWKYGLASTWIGLGNAFIGSLLAWVVLGRRTRVMSQKLESATMPDFFGKRYDSKALKLAASAICFIFLIPYTASIYNGLSRLFAMAFDIPYSVCIITMAVLTGVYVILGGYMATAINDFIQGIIMLIGIVLVIVAVLPQMVHKFYAIKDEHSVKTGTVVSTIFAIIISGGCYFLGGFARLYADADIYKADGSVMYDAIVPQMLSTLPDILIGIVIVLVLSASMSTLSSLVLTSSSTLTLDFIKGTIVKDMKEKTQLIVMRVLIAFFIILSVVIALNPPTFIAQLMGISWGALAGAFLAPFMYGLYSKKITKASVWASFIVGVGLTVSNMFFKFIASPINAGAIAMAASLIVVPLVSLVTPKMKQEQVDEMFTCYDQKVVVSEKTSLGE
ncbi:MAG: sodium:solute symporter [Clostridium sp.]|nr:sodium:solute symporter [Clostridium sp.]